MIVVDFQIKNPVCLTVLCIFAHMNLRKLSDGSQSILGENNFFLVMSSAFVRHAHLLIPKHRNYLYIYI